MNSYDNFAFNEFFLLSMNIVRNNYPSPRFHTIILLIFTWYYIWHLGLAIVGHIYGLHHCGGFDSAYVHVNRNDQFVMIEMMKIACLKIIVFLYVELFCNFFLLRKSCQFLVWCMHSIDCVKKMLLKTKSSHIWIKVWLYSML